VRGSLAGAAAGALTVRVTVGKRVLKPVPFTVPEGQFTRAIALPRDLLPGAVRVEVGGKAGTETLDPVVETLTLPAPPEGIVRVKGASAARGSAFVTRLLGTRRQAWARFRFAVLPARARVARLQWILPSGRRGGAVEQPVKRVMDTFVRARDGLPPGRWTAILRVGGKVVARVAVPIG
jgi:hypothetical protein